LRYFAQNSRSTPTLADRCHRALTAEDTVLPLT